MRAEAALTPPPAPPVQRAERRGQTSRLPVSLVALLAAAGLMVVAVTDTAARSGYASSHLADQAYWLGQALIVVPTAIRLFGRRRLGEAATVTLVVVLTVSEYLVKVCYSPASFTYADELQHWRSAVNLLGTGKLFSVNYLLPISPHYPGLEAITTAVVAVTGLPLYAAGLIVAGTGHLLFVLLVYLLFRQLSSRIFRHTAGAHRMPGVAIGIYCANPDFLSFDAMFAYQTVAVAFLALAVLATWRLATGTTAGRPGWLTIAIAAIVATVLTHHVSSYVLVATLALIAVTSLAAGHRRAAIWPALLALTGVAVIACWIKFAAPDTVSYLAPIRTYLSTGLDALSGGGHAAAPSLTSAPLGNRMLAGAAVVATSVLVLAGVWQAWRYHLRRPWVAAVAVGSLSWFAIVGVRVAVPDGSELAGRASTFVFVPAAFVVALALTKLLAAGLRWKPPLAAAGVIGAGLMLISNGLANGWPPFWERLPGSFQLAGAERSVTPDEIAAASWALDMLGQGNRFATDQGSYPVIGSYGDQDPVRDDSYLYTSVTFQRSDARRAQAQEVGFILVDRRLSQSLPASGQYFPGLDPGAGRYTSPLPLAALTKFDAIPGVSRLYDGGDIVIYDVQGSAYYAP